MYSSIFAVHLPSLLSTLILPEDRVSEPAPTAADTYGITKDHIDRHNVSIAALVGSVFGQDGPGSSSTSRR